METVTVKLKELKINKDNPRTITKEKMDKLVDSILVFPKMLEIRPIVVDNDLIALGGNQRTDALKRIAKMSNDDIVGRLSSITDYQKMPKEEQDNLIQFWKDWLKSKQVQVINASLLTEDEKKQFIIKDNNSFGDWDWNLLEEKWDSNILDDWGVDVPDDWNIPEEKKEEIEEDDFTEEDAANAETRVKDGEIWQLGEHRLMCGDSTKKEDVEKLMNGEKADMTYSDPPYNIGFKGSMSNTTKDGIMIKHIGANQKHDKIKNDKMGKDEFFSFITSALEIIRQNVKGAWYISFSSVNLEELLNPLRYLGMDWKSIIIWEKNQATLSMKDYKSRYEPILYGRFNDAFYGEKAKEEDVWEYQRTLKNDLHPTMKPIPLISNMIKKSSKQKQIVLDLFGGIGSTLIACEQLNRKCYMMELTEHYCDIIIARWEKLTGKEAVKIYG